MWSCRQLPAFWRMYHHFTWKVEVVCSSEMFVATYKTTHHHSPEDHLQQGISFFFLILINAWLVSHVISGSYTVLQYVTAIYQSPISGTEFRQ
jgi:hypothetical protein